MIKYKVEVIGAGKVANRVAHVIDVALREAGFDVDVENAYPDPEIAEIIAARPIHDEHVELVVRHLPWGA